jgi:hypothetical protein
MTKEQAVQWLFEHKDEEGSPEFEKVFSRYQTLAGGDPLKAAEAEYAKVEVQPDSSEKNAALDRLRTQITDLGGIPKLTKGPLVTQQAAEAKKEEAKPKSELPSQADFDAYLQEARKAQLVGGAAASTKYLPEVTKRVLGPTVGALSQAVEEGRLRAQLPAQPPVQSALPAPAPTGTALSPLNQGSPARTNFGSAGYGNQTVLDRSGAVIDPRAPNVPTMDQTGRALQGNIKEPNTPMAQTGRASMTAFNQNTKDVAAGAREQQAVINSLKSNPNSPPLGQIPGGFTASSPTGVALRPSALEPLPPPMLGQTGAPEPSIGAPRPQGPYINPQTIGSAAYRPPMPAPQPVSGLEQVKNTFNRMANSPLGQEVTRASRVLGKGAGAIGTVAAGSEVGLNLYDMIDAIEKGQYGRAGMSGAKAAATGSMIMTPYGLIPAALIYGADWLNDATARAKTKALHGMSPQQAYESEGGFYSANQ